MQPGVPNRPCVVNTMLSFKMFWVWHLDSMLACIRTFASKECWNSSEKSGNIFHIQAIYAKFHRAFFNGHLLQLSTSLYHVLKIAFALRQSIQTMWIIHMDQSESQKWMSNLQERKEFCNAFSDYKSNKVKALFQSLLRQSQALWPLCLPVRKCFEPAAALLNL